MKRIKNKFFIGYTIFDANDINFLADLIDYADFFQHNHLQNLQNLREIEVLNQNVVLKIKRGLFQNFI